MAKNGQKFTPFQQLQANSLQITKKHMMKLPGMKKKTVFPQSNPTGWTLSAQQFRRYSILKLGSRPKYLIFCKKNQKVGSISSLLLTTFVPDTICDLPCVISSLNIGPYWHRIPENKKKTGQNWPKKAAKLHLSSNCRQIVCK